MRTNWILADELPEPPFASRKGWDTGDWITTNWVNESCDSLPVPGYPTNGYCVDYREGIVSIASQDVSIAELTINNGCTLTITNGKVMTLSGTLNWQTDDRTSGYLAIPDGYMNVHNDQTGPVYGVSFCLGTSNTSGYLDFGATWGATNGFHSDFGSLYLTAINLQKGGLRVDASKITMQSTCTVYNAGQEMTFRGDWLNPDGSTSFTVNGKSTQTIDIAGSFSFGGCRLFETIGTNGLQLIQVGGDATLTNTVLTLGASAALTNPAASYDLVRVPAAKTIYTNGMAFRVDGNGGFTYTASLDFNRSGYDYLVITPGVFLPSVTITNPVNGSLYEAVTNLSIQAAASARSGNITKVEFYNGASKIGEATNAPYSVTWTNVYAGSYEVKAVATDNNSNQGSSPVVNVNVQGTASDGRRVFITGGAVIRYDPGCVQ